MSSTPASPPEEVSDIPQAQSPRPSRPQLHIDTTGPPIPSSPPRSRDGRRPSFNYESYPLSSSPSIRSQRSDQPRVRFSSDVQTLGERTMVSPSITVDEALSRLQHSSSQSSLNRRAGSVPSELPHLTMTPSHHDPIRGILRRPKLSVTSYASTTQQSQRQRRPNRPGGWGLGRQLWSKQDSVDLLSGREVGLSSLPPAQNAPPSTEPRLSHTIEDVDAIRVVQSALDQATVDPPVAKIEPKSSSTKKIPTIEPEVTQASLPFYSTWAASRRTRHMLVGRCKELMRRIKRLRDPRLISKGKGREIPINVPDRGKIHLIDSRTGREYVDNLITSSRYTVYSFLPRQIWAQFSKVANFYFLIVAIMQLVPGWSTTGNYTTIIPLSIFLSLSMAREGYDDWRRHRQDKVENNKDTRVLRCEKSLDGVDQATWEEVRWKNVRVGDIIKIVRDEWIPADIILLHSAGDNGIAYIETAALDGETNLKSRQAFPQVARYCQDEQSCAGFRGYIHSEDPNQNLYNFEGKITIGEESLPLSNTEILYRGSILRNTPYIYGFVVFTGEETKIRMNASKCVRTKAPTLQRLVNKVVLIVVLAVVVLAVFCTSGYQLWRSRTENHSWYLQGSNISFIPIVASFIILFNTMIPLALYVSMEIIKLSQMIMLQWDVDMYHEESDTPCEARTATINEELGQVSYIFSDKTGTLTDNVMVFRKMTIAGYEWLHDLDIQRENKNPKVFLKHKKRKGKKAVNINRSASLGNRNDPRAQKHVRRLPTDSNVHGDSHSEGGSISRGLQRSGTWRSTAVPSKPQELQTTMELIHFIQTHPHTIFARRARQFLLGIALCHTCIPEYSSEKQEFEYRAASPDELALVEAAKELGYIVIDRQTGTVTLRTHPNGLDGEPVTEVYTILDVIEFSSARKRMSIILKFPDGRICLFCKGADSVITERLRLSELALSKTREVQDAVNVRRSMEAERAIKSRISISQSRHSMTLSRPSISGSRYEAVRDLDDWLKKRQEDYFVGDDESIEGSAGYDARHSLAFGEFRSPLERTVETEYFIDDRISENDAIVLERTFQHIQDFATEGLRTLLYGHRFLTEQEYCYWRKIYNEAATSLVNRQEKIEQAGELIEVNLEISGATAIEDKLQAGVPDAIDKLRRANIKLWMLTGDKRETAVNIGHSCRLIKDYSRIITLDYNDPELQQTMASARLALNEERVAHSVVVIDGATLGVIQKDPTLFTLYIDLAVQVDSVICCRASPSQKAAMVSAVRKKVKRSVTLAIGDGANDIAMIQEAHVGIGITGREGLQAARASDYSIAQFRFLLKLLLVHGRWFYVRISKYILATFYKEMLFYLTPAMYQGYCGYTGTSLHEQWSLSMFNTLFTSLPVLVLGIFSKDLSATTLLAVPELYTKGQKNGAFSFKLYFGWMFMALSQALICYFIPLYVYAWRDTSNVGVFPLGNLVYTSCILVIIVKIQYIETRNWTIITYATSFITISGWFLWCILLSLMYHNNFIYSVKGSFLHRFGRAPMFWLAAISAFVAATLYDIAIITLRVTFFPKDSDVFAELEKDPLIKARFEEEAASELQQGWNRGKGSKGDDILALLDQPRCLEEGVVGAKPWSFTTKLQTSDGEDETIKSDHGGDVSRHDIRERRMSLTRTGFDEEIAQRFGAVIRKPSKGRPASEAC